MDRGTLKEFDEIRPYEPEEMRQAFDELLSDRQFNVLMKGFAPWLPKSIRNSLLRLAFVGVKTPLDFQLRFMKPIVKYLIRKHTDGCTFDDTMLDGAQSLPPPLTCDIRLSATTVTSSSTPHSSMSSWWRLDTLRQWRSA